jgi:YVTN family beta-propeller protein
MSLRPKSLAAGLAAGAVVTAGIALLAAPADAVGAGTYAYVTNSISGNNSVLIIDTATGSTVATVPTASYPAEIVVSADGKRAYVAEDTGVQVIDATTESVVATIAVPGANPLPDEVSLSPDGSRLYVADYQENQLYVIDTATNTLSTTIQVGGEPSGIVATASKVYVANTTDNTVSVIDAATNTVTNTIAVGKEPAGLALVPSANRLYVANHLSGDLTVIDTTTETVTGTVPAGAGAYQLAVSPDGSRVYATIDNGILVVDSATGAVLTTIDTGRNDFADVAVGPDGRIYNATVQTSTSSTLNVFDPATFELISATTLPAVEDSVDVATIAPTPPPPAKKADVRAGITGPSSGSKNTAYTYTETVKNTGPGVAARVAATAILPQGASLVSASGSYTKIGQLVVWKTVSSMAVNATSTYTLKVKFSSTGTKLVTAAAASLSTPDPNLFNNLALARTSIR